LLDAEVRTEMEGALRASLRYHLDRDLKSWNFLHGVSPTGAPSS
jgi:hypothetical protein